METVRINEKDLDQLDKPLPEGVVIVYFKIVNVGPNTQTALGRIGKDISQIAKAQQGFFLIGKDRADIRIKMHEIVDMACNAGEEKHESAN
jgi:hypothetical protein